MIYPVILCGGAGTRLWPLSRKSYPKQFTNFVGNKSLFQESASRLVGEGFGAPLIVTGEQFRFIALRQVSEIEITPLSLLVEPEAKNTAPAILAAALKLNKLDKNAIMLVMPSDHLIEDSSAFKRTVIACKNSAQNGEIVTFGIAPTGPETGFGYLQLDKNQSLDTNTPQPLLSFVEKPNLETAQNMINSGNYLWNAGIFMFSIETIISSFEKYAPDILAIVKDAFDDGKEDIFFSRLDDKKWAKSPSISIDYAIMEKSSNIVVMPYNGKWSDLGGWRAVWQHSLPDENGNACSENATAIDCTDSLLRSESENLQLVGIGLDDIIAIAMPDAVLIGRKSQSERVKEAVNHLSAKNILQAEAFPKEHRPWGWYESLIYGNSFQVKKIVVYPGQSLSLQSHNKRAEHWVVVEGAANVTIGDKIEMVTESQSVYIPIGVKHRLENPTDRLVKLIEVQTGTYLGEDDIIRYEDIYSRK